MRSIAVGNQSFEYIRREGCFYIDRTDFIRQWYQTSVYVTLITRPRRFGKTLTLDMLNCFFSLRYAGRKELFDGLKVADSAELMERQGTVPVLFLSFASYKPNNWASFLRMMVAFVSSVYTEHTFLLSSDHLNEFEKTTFRLRLNGNRAVPKECSTEGNASDEYEAFLMELQNSMNDLSKWLERYYGKKVFILLDEYDTPLQEAYIHGYWDTAITFMRAFFGRTFKTNRSLERAVITGITRIAKESLFSDLNHMVVASVMSDLYSETFGFTQQEVHNALEEYGLSGLDDQVKTWYDGYTFGTKTEIYNPWSISRLLQEPNHPLQSYWAQSGGLSLVSHLMKHGNLRLHDQFQQLLLGESLRCKISEELIFPRLNQSETAVWSLLLAAGYVKPIPETGNERHENNAWFMEDDAVSVTLTTTNLEMHKAFVGMTKDWFEQEGTNYMSAFLDALTHHDLQMMNETLQEVVMVCVSSFDLATRPTQASADQQPEKYFRGLMTGLVAGAMGRYRITSNGESGMGRYDLTLEPKNPPNDAFQMEFKVFDARLDHSIADTANRALKQMVEKRYDTKLLAAGLSRSQIHQYGIGFCGKEVLILSQATDA